MFSSLLSFACAYGIREVSFEIFSFCPPTLLLLLSYLLPQRQLWHTAIGSEKGPLWYFFRLLLKKSTDSWLQLTRPKACIHVVWGKSAQINLQAYKGHHIAQQTLTRRETFPSEKLMFTLPFEAFHQHTLLTTLLLAWFVQSAHLSSKADSLKETQHCTLNCNHGQKQATMGKIKEGFALLSRGGLAENAEGLG